MNITAYPLSHYTGLLNRHEHFSFARYGDGEWLAILGAAGANCDGHPYSPKLAQELANAVRSDADYLFASRLTAEIEERANDWCRIYRVSRHWHSTEVFLEESLKGKLTPFVTAIRDRSMGSRLAYVGPAHLSHFTQAELGAAHYITVPKSNAYGAIVDLAIGTGEAINKGADTILISAGPAANALIHRLHKHFKGRVTAIDLGSIFDAYVGVKSRSYSRRGRYDFSKLFEANFR